MLTGKPSIGKTTPLKKVIDQLPDGTASGFYTSEIRTRNGREGFKATTLDGQEITLAHVNLNSSIRVGKYGVAVADFERFILPSIDTCTMETGVIIIDETGKMECFSNLFRATVREALDLERIIIGTIALWGDDFIKSIKARVDVGLMGVTYEYRNSLPEILIERLYS